jgi:RNA 3'-phosphate cyclase
MLSIDGSYGEGGGQIVRYAIALSMLTKKPVEIHNIRANRSTPGLRPQHLTAINMMKKLCSAETQGLSLHSSKVVFKPKDIHPGEYTIHIGTAGSITLVAQACILGSLLTPKTITLHITGGTDVKWSPSWDYFMYVFLSLIQKMGITIEASLNQRGYYPKGGGKAELTIYPSNTIHPLDLGNKQSYREIKGIIHSAHIPEHISTRIKHTVLKEAVRHNYKSSIKIQMSSSPSSGVGVTLWSHSKDSTIGSVGLGEKGIPSEVVGQTTAKDLINDVTKKVSIDRFALDQILPYMVLAQGTSTCLVQKITTHTTTTRWLLQQFFEISFEEEKHENVVKIIVKNTFK